MSGGYRIFSLSNSALTVEFGNEISVELNKRAIALSDHLESNPFPGFVETVPAYASTTIFYDVAVVRAAFPNLETASSAVRNIAELALSQIGTADKTETRTVDIPVYFDAASALDLKYLAQHAGLPTNEVIEIFISRTYRVFMLGFLPGFTYMAEVDGRIATARKDTPRTSVPRGSVGIAGKQTGIYSLESPGGWQIVGRTDIELFTPDGDRPTLLQPGDQVRFVRTK